MKYIKNRNRLLLLVLISTIFILIIFLIISILKVREMSITANRYENEIFRLIDEKNELAFATPMPGTNFQKGTKMKVLDFTLTCPDGADCNFDENTGYFNTKILHAIKIEKLSIKTINNPNFTSSVAWYNALLHKDGKAVGSNLKPDYGGRPGYEWGPVLPFYKYYDLDSMNNFAIGTQAGLVLFNHQSGNYDYLIPHNQTLYRFQVELSGGSHDIQLMSELMNTIEFEDQKALSPSINHTFN